MEFQYRAFIKTSFTFLGSIILLIAVTITIKIKIKTKKKITFDHDERLNPN